MMSLISGYRSIVYEYQEIKYLFPRVPVRAPTICFGDAEEGMKAQKDFLFISVVVILVNIYVNIYRVTINDYDS